MTHHKREGTSEPSHFFDLYQLPSIFHFTTRLIKQIESTRHFPLLNPSHWLTFYFKYSNSRLPYALSLSVFINLVKFHTSPLSLHHLHFCLFLSPDEQYAESLPFRLLPPKGIWLRLIDFTPDSGIEAKDCLDSLSIARYKGMNSLCPNVSIFIRLLSFRQFHFCLSFPRSD